MRIIDTHLHLIYQDRFEYPWLADVPDINRNFWLDTYYEQAGALGIERALHIEADVVEGDLAAETRFITGLGPPIAGAVSSGRPEHGDFPAFVEWLAATPGVKGVRRVLHTMADELSQSDHFARNVRRLAEHELPFELCVLARQLPIGRALVDRCPDVQFVLDHCGVPDIAGAEAETWRTEIAELARRPNVAAKISGVVAYAGQGWTVDDLRPYVEHVIEQFGWDRLVWGSDFPVCNLTASLAHWVDASLQLTASASQSEKDRLFHANAERIYAL